MARPRTLRNDAAQAAVLNAARVRDAEHPSDNAAFLAAWLDDAWRLTGRLYGSATYLAWLRVAEVRRRPNATTIQRALERLWARLAATDAGEGAPKPPATPSLPANETPLGITQALVRLEAAVARAAAGAPSTDRGEVSDWAGRARQAEQALALAYEQNRILSQEVARLREAVGQARGDAEASRAAVAEAWATLSERLAASEAGSVTLLAAAEALTRTERFLTLQSDAVRQQASQAAQQWRARAEAAERRAKELGELVDTLRQALRK